jgi:hypothetical protein
MHDDLSVFSDETLAALYEDLMGALDDGVGTPRTRYLLHRVAMEQSQRAVRGIAWELVPFSFVPISVEHLVASRVFGPCGCVGCRSPGGFQ